jgi:hypothetical protein
MFRTDTGGPAFPRPGFYPPTNGNDDFEHIREMMPSMTEPQPGMTLFDYYVGQALQGLLANPHSLGLRVMPINKAEAEEMVNQIGGAAIVYAHAAMEARAEYLALPRKPRAHTPEEE